MHLPVNKTAIPTSVKQESRRGLNPQLTRSRLDSFILFGLLVVLVFTALAFGSVEAWAIFTFELLVIFLSFFWGVRAFIKKQVDIKIPLTLLPVVFLFAIGVIQSLPFYDAGGAIHSLSKDVEATRWATALIFFLILCGFLTVNVLTDRERIPQVAGFLVIYGLALAVFALIQHLSWDNRFYWLRPTDQGSAFGPFVNRNHYAGYMEMLIPLPAAMIFTKGVRSEMRLFYSFAVIIMSVSLVMSASRGGMVSLAAGLAFVAVFLIQKMQKPQSSLKDVAGMRGPSKNLSRKKAFLIYAPLVLAFVVIVFGGLLWLGPEPVLIRISDTVNSISQENVQAQYLNRDWIWKDTLAIFRANPIIGCGLGSFETVYPQYGHGDGTTVVPQAHNDYLQILADAGILGALGLLSFLMLFFYSLVKSLKLQDSKLRGVALGMGGGVFAMLVHSFFDFNLQIPANALLFLFLVSVVSCLGEITPEKNAEAL